MFEALKNAAIAAGLVTEEKLDDTKGKDNKPVVMDKKAQIQPSTQGPIFFDSPPPSQAGSDVDLFNAILSNINTKLPENNILKLMDMSDSMKNAIPEEGTRIKAASAVLHLKQSDLIMTLDQLNSSLVNEGNGFQQNDVAAMNEEIAQAQAQLDEVKTLIENLTQQLSDASTKQSELTQLVASKQSETSNKINVFTATSAKVSEYLDTLKKKITIYVTEG